MAPDSPFNAEKLLRSIEKSRHQIEDVLSGVRKRLEWDTATPIEKIGIVFRESITSRQVLVPAGFLAVATVFTAISFACLVGGAFLIGTPVSATLLTISLLTAVAGIGFSFIGTSYALYHLFVNLTDA